MSSTTLPLPDLDTSLTSLASSTSAELLPDALAAADHSRNPSERRRGSESTSDDMIDTYDVIVSQPQEDTAASLSTTGEETTVPLLDESTRSGMPTAAEIVPTTSEPAKPAAGGSSKKKRQQQKKKSPQQKGQTDTAKTKDDTVHVHTAAQVQPSESASRKDEETNVDQPSVHPAADWTEAEVVENKPASDVTVDVGPLIAGPDLIAEETVARSFDVLAPVEDSMIAEELATSMSAPQLTDLEATMIDVDEVLTIPNISLQPTDISPSSAESLTEDDIVRLPRSRTIQNHPLAEQQSPAADRRGVMPSPSLDSLSSTKLAKRVSFRSEKDEDLVSGFFNAPDPWKYANESTMQSVLEAYAHSCLHHKVQPLPKVLDAIKRNPGNRQRAGVFDISGETLDLKVIDTFEAIFMRMCFEELNLSACLIDDDLAVAIMDMLEYYQMADKLVISNNKKLQFRGWLSLAKVLKKCCVYYLDVRGCVLQDQNAALLTRAIRCGSNLVTLHMENCVLTGRPAFLLISALQYSETVQELFVGDNKLCPTDMVHFATALKQGWKIRLLDLRSNLIMDSGATHLLEAFTEPGAALPAVRQLVLWNNHLTVAIAKTLARAVMAATSLETLNLGVNDFTDEAVFILKESLMMNHTLRRLGLQNTKLSDEGCIALAEYLADHPRFLRLDVRYNNIRGGGWLALSHAAKLSPAIIRVDMNYSFKDVKHFETIRACQKTIQTTCLANIERFEKGLATTAAAASEEEPEIPPADSTETVEEIVAEKSESSEIPEFSAAEMNVDLDIDVPTKKCRPSTLRRCSITSVSSTGPLSVIDRLQEELFPLQNAAQVAAFTAATPSPSSYNNPPVQKGRFQISLVKATEKIYQSVQSVLSPTTNPPPFPNSGIAPDLVSPGSEAKPGLFSWRATFRRGSKEIQPTDLPAPNLSASSDSAKIISPSKEVTSPLSISTADDLVQDTFVEPIIPVPLSHEHQF